MTIREKLEQYRALRIEIKNLEQRISDLQTEKVSSCDVIKTSDSDFPYTMHSSKVIGYHVDKATLGTVATTYKERLAKAKELLSEVESFISSVEDSEMRELLTLRYVDGLPWWKIPGRLGLAGDGSWQCKLVYRFLRNFAKCPESQGQQEV